MIHARELLETLMQEYGSPGEVGEWAASYENYLRNLTDEELQAELDKYADATSIEEWRDEMLSYFAAERHLNYPLTPLRKVF